jgi:hypothetical protein
MDRNRSIDFFLRSRKIVDLKYITRDPKYFEDANNFLKFK